jgi:LysM repeat protein
MFVANTKITNAPNISEAQGEDVGKPNAKHIAVKKNEKVNPVEGKNVKAGLDYHVVQPAQTLYSIARMHGMTVDELKELNGLNSNTLGIGQRLKVNKGEPQKGASDMYVVKDGDTMFSIAKRFGIPLEELKQINHLDSYKLYESMVLKVGKGAN